MFEDLQINKSIFIPTQGSNLVRFIVTRISEKSFKAVVQSEDSNFEVNCFETTINFTYKNEFKGEIKEYSTLKQLDFNVEEKFYDDLLFHHGPFRRINSFLKIQALESIAKADSNLMDQWFGAYIPQNYLLGDPGLNDAAIHCHQACRPGSSLLPTGAGQVAINPLEIKGPFFIKTIETREEKNSTIIDVCVMNNEGEVKMFWKDLRLTQVSGTSFKGQWDPHLLVPYIEYKIMKLSNTRNIRLPLDSCLELVRSLEADEKSEVCNIEGYSISLNKLKISEAGKTHPANGNGHSTGNGTHTPLEINIANLTEKVLLQIFQSDKN